MTDEMLLVSTKRLAITEREILAEVLHHLAEIQRRKLFSPSFTSLQDYAQRELGYSEDQATRRIAAMWLMIELPEIEADILSGALNVTKLGLARTHFRIEEALQVAALGQVGGNESDESARHGKGPEITRESKLEILEKLKGQSTREATRTLIAESSRPERIRHFESVKPVSATMNKLEILADDETLDKISRLKGLLAHKHPHLSNGELFSMALDIALETLNPAHEPKRAAKKNASSVDAESSECFMPSSVKKESSSESEDSSEIEHTSSAAADPEHKTSAAPRNEQRSAAHEKRSAPAAMSREIWRAAEGRCHQCGSHHALEEDHQIAFALGGPTTPENMRLLCRNCNQRHAIKDFGVWERPPRGRSRVESPHADYVVA